MVNSMRSLASPVYLILAALLTVVCYVSLANQNSGEAVAADAERCAIDGSLAPAEMNAVSTWRVAAVPTGTANAESIFTGDLMRVENAGAFSIQGLAPGLFDLILIEDDELKPALIIEGIKVQRGKPTADKRLTGIKAN